VACSARDDMQRNCRRGCRRAMHQTRKVPRSEHRSRPTSPLPSGRGVDGNIELLMKYADRPPEPKGKRPGPRAPRRRSGWWTPMSVAQLRDIVRQHGVAVPAGMRRAELVQLLIDHDVPRSPIPQGSHDKRRIP